MRSYTTENMRLALWKQGSASTGHLVNEKPKPCVISRQEGRCSPFRQTKPLFGHVYFRCAKSLLANDLHSMLDFLHIVRCVS